MWTSEIQLDQAHEARERINIPSLSLVLMSQNLERYDVMVLASLIRLYLMELPECLLTFELYDPIKLLYTNRKFFIIIIINKYVCLYLSDSTISDFSLIIL